MIILGVDPGFDKMGCAVLSKTNNKDELVYSTCIITNRKDAHEKRLLFIGEKLKKIISKYKPEIIAVEKIFFTTNQKTALKVAEARGIVLYLAALRHAPVVEFTPLEIKMAITGYGKADKEQVKKMVKAILKTEKIPEIDDEIDAIAVALTCPPRGGQLHLSTR
ncbi:MAG: crossover junction endodeoxyribonuclease RuvC [Patescibacteria group bacterium]